MNKIFFFCKRLLTQQPDSLGDKAQDGKSSRAILTGHCLVSPCNFFGGMMSGEVKILQTFIDFKQKHLLLFHVNSLWHYRHCYRYFGEGWEGKKINLPQKSI